MRGRRAPLIAAAIAVALVVLLVVFLVLPKMGEVSTANDELAAARAQQGTLESQLAALEQAQAAAPEAKDIIQDVEEQIPPTADEAGMLLLVRNAAVQSGITLTTLTPGNPVLDPTTGLSVITLAVSAEGTYFALTEFLYSLETLPRAAKVQNVSMAPGGSTTTTTTTTASPTLSLQAGVRLSRRAPSAGRGWAPGPTQDAAATGGA